MTYDESKHNRDNASGRYAEKRNTVPSGTLKGFDPELPLSALEERDIRVQTIKDELPFGTNVRVDYSTYDPGVDGDGNPLPKLPGPFLVATFRSPATGAEFTSRIDRNGTQHARLETQPGSRPDDLEPHFMDICQSVSEGLAKRKQDAVAAIRFNDEALQKSPTDLATWGPSAEAEFNRILTTPTDEDHQSARDSLRIEVGNAWPHRWEAAMGPKARRTEANIAAYHSELDHIIEQTPALKSRLTTFSHSFAKDRSFARAHKAGVAIHPAAEEYFDEQWGSDKPWGEAGVRDELTRATQLRESFERGAIKPAKIIGTGYRNPKKVAKEYLDSRVADLQQQLDTRGRSNTSLVHNVWRRIKEAEQ